jgi:hypothetical protein
MAEQQDVYVMIWYHNLLKAFCLDRSYMMLPDDDELWRHIKMADIVQSDDNWLPPLASIPEWASEAESVGEKRVAFWTNYYEPKLDPYKYRCLLCGTVYTKTEYAELSFKDDAHVCSNCRQCSWQEV